MPTLHIDDATEHLVGHLRDGITEPTPAPVITDKRGCDLWLPIVVAKFWQSRGHPTFTAYPREQQDADIGYFRPFYDGMGALPGSGFFGRDKPPQWETRGLEPSFKATASVLPNLVAAGCKPPLSIRRATRAGLARCCNRLLVGLAKASHNARQRHRAAIERRITSPAVSWPAPQPNPFCLP